MRPKSPALPPQIAWSCLGPLIACLLLVNSDAASGHPGEEKKLTTGTGITVGGARFEPRVEAVWVLPTPGAETKVAIQLRVTNLTSAALRFPKSGLRLELTDAAGQTVTFDGGSNALKSGGAFFSEVAPSQSLTIDRPARLVSAKDSESLRLIGTDDLGGVWYFDRLKPGSYRLRFVYESKTPAADGETPVWQGTAKTSPLMVTIR